jgi:hypothetical protein
MPQYQANSHYDKQEEFLDGLIDSVKSMRECARDEDLFETIDSIIEEVTEKMKELKE